MDEPIAGSRAISRRTFLRSGIALATSPVLASPLVAQDDVASCRIQGAFRSIRLPCGRRLAFTEYGNPRGWPIIHQHGIPSCRWEPEQFREALQYLGNVRMIGVDRPGIGRSDPDAQSHFLTWPADVVALADALGIELFSMTAISAGAPYALATARALPQRVTGVILCGPVAPLQQVGNVPGFFALGVHLAQRHELMAKAFWAKYVAGLRRHPERMPFAVGALPPADSAIAADPVEVREQSRLIIESQAQGPAQTVRAFAILGDPWSTWLGDVHTRVTIFQGCDDGDTPPVMARWLASVLPNAELRLIPGEAHVSVVRHYGVDILRAALPLQ
ncbi:MAG TPA: alpha/beta hydrolase [Gemmataceae bacterium]|nr:alpha/beta hydrolase [Gemmataceae bacterium]